MRRRPPPPGLSIVALAALLALALAALPELAARTRHPPGATAAPSTAATTGKPAAPRPAAPKAAAAKPTAPSPTASKPPAPGRSDKSVAEPRAPITTGTPAIAEVGLDARGLELLFSDRDPDALPTRVAVRKVDLVASLLAGFDPDAEVPLAGAVRFAGPERAAPAKPGAKLDCGSDGPVCRIAALGTDAPGAYWVTAARGKKAANALVLRPGAHVWVRGDAARLVVFGTDDGGAPLARAVVSVLAGRKVLGKGELSTDGIGTFAAPGGGPARRTFVVVRSAGGDEALLVHAPVAATPAPFAAEVLTDRPAYAPGDEVRLFAVTAGAPRGVASVRVRDPGGEEAVASLSAVGTFVAALRPTAAPGRRTLRIEVDGAPGADVPLDIAFRPAAPAAADGAGAVDSTAPLSVTTLPPVVLPAGTPLRAAGPRWTRALERAGMGEAWIRAVPLGATDRAAAATGPLVDPGELAAMAVERTIDVRFHDDVRYEIPFDALTAFGGPSVAYVTIAEKPAAGAEKSASGALRLKAGAKGGAAAGAPATPAAPLWSFVVLAAGAAPPPALPAREPDDDHPVTVAAAFLRSGDEIPLKARLSGGARGVAVLEDHGVLAAVGLGPGSTRGAPLRLPASSAGTFPHLVTHVGFGAGTDGGLGGGETLPLLSARRWLGIDLRSSASALTIDLYDEGGAPVSGEVGVVVAREEGLPAATGWTSPARHLYAAPDADPSGCAAADAVAVEARYYAPEGGLAFGAGDFRRAGGGPAPAGALLRAAPPPLLWATLHVAGTANVPWARPADGPALLRVTVLAAADGRVGRRVFFIPIE